MSHLVFTAKCTFNNVSSLSLVTKAIIVIVIAVIVSSVGGESHCRETHAADGLGCTAERWAAQETE